MKTRERRFTENLAVTGGVGLALLAIPVLAVVVFVLRAAVLAAAIAAVAVGVTLWLTSARFRAWLAAWIEPDLTYKGLRLAPGVALHSGHAWARMSGEQVVVGADDLLPAVLGPVESVALPSAGRQVARGDVLFSLRHGTRAVDVQAPVSGTVVAANAALARDPGLINADPFRRGWTVKLRGAPDSGGDGRELRHGRDANAWFRTEVDQLLATITGDVAAVPVMADGGVLAGDLYQHIDDGTWRRVTESLKGARS